MKYCNIYSYVKIKNKELWENLHWRLPLEFHFYSRVASNKSVQPLYMHITINCSVFTSFILKIEYEVKF